MHSWKTLSFPRVPALVAYFTVRSGSNAGLRLAFSRFPPNISIYIRVGVISHSHLQPHHLTVRSLANDSLYISPSFTTLCATSPSSAGATLAATQLPVNLFHTLGSFTPMLYVWSLPWNRDIFTLRHHQFGPPPPQLYVLQWAYKAGRIINIQRSQHGLPEDCRPVRFPPAVYLSQFLSRDTHQLHQLPTQYTQHLHWTINPILTYHSLSKETFWYWTYQQCQSCVRGLISQLLLLHITNLISWTVFISIPFFQVNFYWL